MKNNLISAFIWSKLGIDISRHLTLLVDEIKSVNFIALKNPIIWKKARKT